MSSILTKEAEQISFFGKPKKLPSYKGYIAPPGSYHGVAKCKDCAHFCRVKPGNKAYLKCALMESKWTNGPATDIQANAPACKRFEKNGQKGGNPSPEKGYPLGDTQTDLSTILDAIYEY